MTSPLISTDELAARLNDPDLRVVDGSWHLDGRDARADFEARHIPDAIFFDLDQVSDRTHGLPHMLPKPREFAQAAGGLGIGRDDAVVAYDTLGLFSAARVWWTFRTMGARDVRVLDGGLPAWLAQGGAVEAGSPHPAPRRFQAEVRPNAVADLDDVRRALLGSAQVVDARPAARFRGEMAEPRPGLRSGHMPGAINLPFRTLMDDNGRLLRGRALGEAFQSAGVDPDRPVVTTCGSGVTAAIVNLALAELGRDSRLYDGSWAEWGGRPDTQVVTGP